MFTRIVLAGILTATFASAQPGPGGFPGPGIRIPNPTIPASERPSIPTLPTSGTSVLRPEALRYPGTANVPSDASLVVIPPAPTPQPPTDPLEEARFFFESASARVADARRAVEAHSARLEEMGLRPDTDLVSNVTAAEAALKAAQEAITARDFDAARDAIRRANILARSVLNILSRDPGR